jgi:hypothetical protein
VAAVVDLGEVDEVLRAELGGGREEAALARLLAEAPERVGQQRLVVGPDRAQQEGAPVAQLDSPLAPGAHRRHASVRV